MCDSDEQSEIRHSTLRLAVQYKSVKRNHNMQGAADSSVYRAESADNFNDEIEDDEEASDEESSEDEGDDDDGDGDDAGDFFEERIDEDTLQDERGDMAKTIRVHSTPTLPSLSSKLVREIGLEAIWTVSSAKAGNGVAQLRDWSPDSYWQSDGLQPHFINIHFLKRVSVSEISFYLDFSLDESYTPRKISIKSGMTTHELTEIKVIELHEPKGWCSVELVDTFGSDPLDFFPDDLDDENDQDTKSPRKKITPQQRLQYLKRPIRTNFLQVCVLQMHQNGKGTYTPPR